MNRRLLLAVGLVLLAGIQQAHAQMEPPPSAAETRHERQVAMSIQVVSVPDATWENAANFEWIVPPISGAFTNDRLAFLSPAKLNELMESLHKDKRTETQHLPR